MFSSAWLRGWMWFSHIGLQDDLFLVPGRCDGEKGYQRLVLCLGACFEDIEGIG
jgi:hypothetical protein